MTNIWQRLKAMPKIKRAKSRYDYFWGRAKIAKVAKHYKYPYKAVDKWLDSTGPKAKTAEAKTTDPEIDAEMREAQKAAKLRKELQSSWLERNNKFDSAKVKKDWEHMRERMRPILVSDTVDAMSLMDSVQAANETLDFGMNIEASGIQDELAREIISKVFLIRFAQRVMDTLKLPKYLQQTMLQRLAARELPLKDNLQKDTSQQMAMQMRQLQTAMSNMAAEYKRNANANLPMKQKKPSQAQLRAERQSIIDGERMPTQGF